MTITEQVHQMIDQGYTKDEIIPLFPGSKKHVQDLCNKYIGSGDAIRAELDMYNLVHFGRWM